MDLLKKEEILEEIKYIKARIKHDLLQNQLFLFLGFVAVTITSILLVFYVINHKYFLAIFQAICVGINVFSINLLDKSRHRMKDILRQVEEREVFFNDIK